MPAPAADLRSPATSSLPETSSFAFTTGTHGTVSSGGNPEGNGLASSGLSRPRFFKVRRQLGSGTASRGRLDSNSNQFSSIPDCSDQSTFGSTSISGSLKSGRFVGNSNYTSVGDRSSLDKDGNFAFGAFHGVSGTDDRNVNAYSEFEKTEQLNSLKGERVAGNAGNLGSVNEVLGKEEHSTAEYKRLSSDGCNNWRTDDKPELEKQASSSFVFGSSQVHLSSKFNSGTKEFCEQFGNLSFGDKNTTSETQKVKATNPILNSYIYENSSSSRHHDDGILVFKGNSEGNPFHQRGNEKENLNPAKITKASGTNSFTSATSAFVFKSGSKNSELCQGSMSGAMPDQSSNPNVKPYDIFVERNEVKKDDGNEFAFGCSSNMTSGSTQTISSKQFEFQAGSSESLDSNSSNHQTRDEFRVPDGISTFSKTNIRNSGCRKVKLRQRTDKLLAEKHHKQEESNVEENFGSPCCSPMDFSPYQEARTDEYLEEQMKPTQPLNNNTTPSVSSGKVFHSFGGVETRLVNENGGSKFRETCFGSEAAVKSSKGEGVCSSARDASAFPRNEDFASKSEAQKFDSKVQYGFTSGPETFNEARFVFSASPPCQATSMRNKGHSKEKRVSSIKLPNYAGTSLPSDTTEGEEDGSSAPFTFKENAQYTNKMKNLNLERDASSQYSSSSNTEKPSQGSDATNATQKLQASENAASGDGNVFVSKSQERFSSVQFTFSSGPEDISQGSFVFNGSLSAQHNSMQRKSRDKKSRDKRRTVSSTPFPVVEDGSSSTQFSFSSRGSVSSETMGCQQEDGSSARQDEVKAHVGEEQMHDEQKIFPSAVQEACEKWRFRGNQAYQSGFFSRAERFYTKGIDSVPAHETSSCCKPLLLCYSNRAASRMSLGRIRDAIDDCFMAVELDPNFLKVQMRAANCYLVLGEVDAAIGYFSKCIASGASVCLDRRLLIEAADGLQRAKKVAEYVNLATSLMAEGSDVDRALKVISEAISVSKFSEQLLEMKAEALYMLQKYEEVIQLCEQSLVVAEKNFLKSSVVPADFADGKDEGISDVKLWRFFIMAKSHFSLGKLDEALDLLQKVEKAGSTTKRSSEIIQSSLSLSTVISKLLQCKNMGNEAFRSKKYDEAVEHYTAALSTNIESRPFAAICFCNRAASYQALGQITDAIADCSLAISLNGSYTKAISRRASLHELIRDHGHAANDLRLLISILEDQQKNKASTGSSGTNDRVNDLRKSQKRLSAVEEQAKRAIPLEFYLILGVKKSDTAGDIKKAYRKAALRHHPDKAGQFLARSEISTEGHHLWKAIGKEIHEDADRLFKIIGEAYAVLSDPSKRAQYDMDEEIRAAPKESSSSSFFRSSSPYRSYTSSNDYDSNYSYGRSNSSRRYWRESWKTHGNSESRW